jgi:uncharacterized OB-fold protein
MVAPGVFTMPSPDRDAVLLGGRCAKCGRNFFPRPPRCPHCLGPVKEKDLGSTGRLYTYTVVRVKPPWGLPKPYGLGYVDLDQGNMRVLGLLAPHALQNLKIGMRLRLAVAELGNNLTGEPCLRPYFEPDETMAARGEGNV